MSCKIENLRNKGEGIESKLGQSLLEIYSGNLDQAKLQYEKIASDDYFISRFGDWVNEKLDKNVNDQGEPLLYTDVKADGSKHHYFILQNGNQYDVIPREFSSFSPYDLTNEIKEITENIVRYIYTNNFNSDFESLDGSTLDIVGSIAAFVAQEKAPLDEYIRQQGNNIDPEELAEIAEIKEYLDKIITHSDEFKAEVIKFFNERKLNIKDTVLEDTSQQNQEEGLQGGDLIQSIERNSKDSVTANVKLMLSFLPKVNNATGEEITGGYLGGVLFQPFDAVYSDLQSQLHDITTLYLEGSVSDVYKSMVTKISELSNAKKSYKVLLDMLDKLDENGKTEFIQAFYLSKVNFYTSTISGSGSEFRMIVQNVSNVGGPIDTKLNNYNVNFRDLLVKGGKLNILKIKELRDKNNAILKKVRSGNRIAKLKSEEEFLDQFAEDANDLIEIFEQLGVTTITGESFELFLKQLRFEDSNNSYKLMYNKLAGTLMNLDTFFGKLMSKDIDIASENPFKAYSGYIFNSLAESEAYFEDNLATNSIFSSGKTYFNMTKPSYLANKINQFKQTPDSLRGVLSSDYSRDSLWGQHLLAEEKTADGEYTVSESSRQGISENRLKNLELGRFNNLQEQDKSAEGTDNKEISYVDQLVDNINKVLFGSLKGRSSIYTTSTPADKASLHEIKIDYFIEDTVYSSTANNTIEFRDKILNIFADYFTTEIDRMRVAYHEVNELPEDKLRIFYHFNEKGEKMTTITDSEGNKRNVMAGNAFRSSHIFSELSPENISKELNDRLQLYKSDYSPLNTDVKGLTNEQRKLLKREINTILNKAVAKDFDHLFDLKIFKSLPNGVIVTNGIDNSILEQHKVDKRLTYAAALNITSDYVLNSMIANIEYTKLFTGDPAYYKNMVDFFKRVPSTYTDGTNLRIIAEDDVNFDIAVLENIKVESPFLKEIKESLATTNLSKEEQKYIVDAYSDVNQTDAQGWITPERWAFLMSRTGKWNSKYQAVYDKIKKSEPLNADELKTVAQPLKGVYFGLVGYTPTYLKYSQAVLLPQLVKGTSLEKLAKQMEKQGISEAITLDGVKVGAGIPNKWTDKNGDIKVGKLNTITLQNSDWKLQQDLPTKTIKPTLLGSQIQKNILKSIYDDSVYSLEDETIDGLDMYTAINDITSALSTSSIQHLSRQLGRAEDGTINKKKLYDLLEKELLDRGTATNLLKAVQKNLPIEAIPGIKDKLYNIIFSKVRSSASKLKTNGGSFIQMSNFGLDKVTGDEVGVTWLVEPSALKPPVIEKDADGKSFIVPGQILISHSQIAKYIPNYKELAKKGQLEKLLDEKLLRAIGYRIPNQGMSSNDPLQIVGILPEAMGDTIVAYTEITTKTGSDFDIDKMYVMLPNPELEYADSLRDTLLKAGFSRNVSARLLSDHGIMVETTEDKVNAPKRLFYLLRDMKEEDQPLSDEENTLLNGVKDATVKRLGYLQFDKSKPALENSPKQLQNRLFELYWSILTNEKSYGDLITPIDFPHIKNKIKELHGDNRKQTGELLKFNDPIYQLKLKFIYAAGKSGVGITANMLVDHNRSKFRPMTFNNYYLGVGHRNYKGSTVFDMEYSEELNGTRYKIGDTISAFLNAFVDNAKDPYINDGNFNTYTSSVAFMMMRAGVHPDYIVAFIGQPVLKRLAEFTNEYESKSIPKENAALSSFDIAVQNLENKLYNTPEKGITFDELKPDIGNFSYNTLANSIKGKSKLSTVENLQILKIFKEFQEQAKKLNNSVQLSRFDTNGAGKNIIELMILKNKMAELYKRQNDFGELNGHFFKYYNEELGGITSLGTQMENTLVYIDEMLNNNPELFLLGSKPVQDMLNSISMSLVSSRGGSRGLLKDENLGKLLMKEIYKYIMSDFPKFKVEGSPLDYIKETSQMITEYALQDKTNTERNFFIENITKNTNSFGIVNKSKSREFEDRLYRSARDLMEENPELADRIFISSFLMNGFENKIIDIKEFIPYEWFIQNGIREFITDKNIQMQNSPTMLSDFREQLIRNNVENNLLVPKVSVKKALFISKGFKSKDVGFALDGRLSAHKRYILDHTQSTLPIFVEYVRLGPNLFKLAAHMGYTAVYLPTEKLGFEDKKSSLDLKEYSFNSGHITSHFGQLSDHSKKAARMREWAFEGTEKTLPSISEELGYEFNRRNDSNREVDNVIAHGSVTDFYTKVPNIKDASPMNITRLNDIIVFENEDPAFALSVEYKGRSYSFVLEEEGGLVDVTYYDPNSLKDIDVRDKNIFKDVDLKKLYDELYLDYKNDFTQDSCPF